MDILLDMDGVVTDFVPALIEQYNFLTGEHVKVEQIRGRKTEDFVQDPPTIKRIKNSVGFLRGLPPADGAVDAISKLVSDGHKVLFVSVNTNCATSANEKREWLNFYFSKVWQKAPLITTPPEYKKFVRGDVLVDDDHKNLIDLHPDTKGLLWHQQYNASITGFERIYGWDHLEDWIYKNEK